jgi:hypothetical protein
LCISDASPATFETPLDARREDDHPDAEEEPDKTSQLKGKDDAFTGQDDKSSQDFDKGNETLDLFVKVETARIALRCN